MSRLTTCVLLGTLIACSSDIPCTVPHDCPVSQRCMNGNCAEPNGTPGNLGDACKSNADCPSGLTCTSEAFGYPGGYCTAACADASACGANGACTPIGSTKVCTPTCSRDAQCRQGYGCCATLADTCVPLAACPLPACVRPVVDSALPAAQVQKFGTHRVGDEVTFTVPANTGSLTIVQQAQIASLTIVYRGTVLDNSAVPLSITLPDGGLAYDDLDGGPAVNPSPDGGIDPSGEYAFYGGGTPSTVAFTVPNTSTSLTGGIPEGTWKFKVNDYAYECTLANVSGCTDGGTLDNTYEVSVLTRPARGGSTMAVDFYIVADMNNASGQPLTAANAGTDPSVLRMEKTYKDLMTRAGITANVTFRDVSANDRARFGTNISAQATGPCDELSQMFTLSGQNPGNTMNVFLVQGLRSASSGGGTVVGIDGTIPGPSSYNGTVHSGAVVSAVDLFASNLQNCPASGFEVGACGPDRVAYIAAHETGHFLGLFHTTEQEGADFDPLNDTAKCPCTSCASPPDRPNCGSPSSASQPSLTNNLCLSPGAGCGGGDNLMFWFLQPGGPLGNITAQQAQVMRLNPVVQ